MTNMEGKRGVTLPNTSRDQNVENVFLRYPRSQTMRNQSDLNHHLFTNGNGCLESRQGLTNGLRNEEKQANGRRSRPVSWYDNFPRETLEISMNERRETREIRFNNEEMPSLTYSLNTTVPQNIKAANIAGKHAPTRNSLRHSRMIVMNRSGTVPRKSQPPIMRYHRLAKAHVGLQTLLGVLLCFLSLWLIMWAPNIRTRDNPFWSAIPLLLSGMFGLILLYCCRKEYPGMPMAYCVYSTKAVSVILSTVAAAACFTASAFAVIHLIALYSMTCAPKDKITETCVCTVTNSTLPIKSYHYVDLSCPEVDSILSILVIFSAVVNLLAGIICAWYVLLHWTSRYLYTYSRVRMNEDEGPTVFSNS